MLSIKQIKQELLCVALTGDITQYMHRQIENMPMHAALHLIEANFKAYDKRWRVPATLLSSLVGHQTAAHNRLMLLNKIYPEE